MSELIQETKVPDLTGDCVCGRDVGTNEDCERCMMIAMIVNYEKSAAKSVEKLERACRVYCRWYDNGQPEWMSGEQCAYEMVSAIRQALADLKGES